MFNNGNRKRDPRPAMPPAPPMPAGARGRGMFSVIGPDVTIVGNVSATADLHVDGRIEGNVECVTLAQGTESQIFGNVTADSARLAGAVEGVIRVKQLTVERTARITGDVEYEAVSVENGGHVDGRMKHMTASEAAIGPRAVPSAPVDEEAA